MGVNISKSEKNLLRYLGVKKESKTLAKARIPRVRSRNSFRARPTQRGSPAIQNDKNACKRIPNNGQFVPRWTSLNQDAQLKILEQLPIADLMNARLAGLDGETPQLRHSTRHLMRKRCDQLQPLWNEWKNSSRLKSREYRHSCDPVQFTSVKNFAACHCSISCMKHLWHLRDLKRLSIKFCPLFEPQLEDLNETLRGCPGLLRLNLSSCPYQHFPESILTLKKLRCLDLSKSLTISNQLPHDMGERLPHLRFLDLSYCISVTHIPESILLRLETHRKQTSLRGRPLTYCSLALIGCDSDQKQKLVPALKYPLLAASI